MSSTTHRKPKAKIGTVLDKEVIRKLKERALREGKPINALIEEAVLHYEHLDTFDHAMRLRALDSLLSIQFNISKADWKAVMKEDVSGNEP